MGRLLVPVTVAIPIVIAYFRFLNERSGWVSTELGIALVLLSYIVILTTALFITISSLNSRDQARNDFVAKINNLNIELKEMHDWQLTSNEELTASNEEIKSANEELSAINEQLTSATETIKAQDLIIIEQKEEALKRSQQHLDIIFSNTREEILLMNPEGKLVIFNKALESFITHATGHKPRVGMYVWDMTVPSRREESKRIFEDALSGKTVTTEAVVNTPTGEVTHFLRYEPVILDEKVSFVTLISVDITERKQAEDKLKRQFEELEKTNYELDHFVYSVSHDLRAPLSSILGLVNVAEMEKGDKLPFLGMIKGRVNHLDGFIKDILDYSHNARLEFQNKKIGFSDLLEETKYNLKLIDGFDRLKIKVKLSELVPFYSDYHRLAIIFNNIISNAIKFQDYSKQDSTLTLSITSSEDRLEIIAADNGIGIATDQIDKIFNMFHRATERSKGSGLGLYIVKETVAKLHGTISVKSKFREYTSFEITIPNSQ
jgi:PAS domain S-box-containing protein